MGFGPCIRVLSLGIIVSSFLPSSPSVVLPDGTTNISWTLGDETINDYISPHPYQFPDSVFPVLNEDSDPNSSLMFWTDGTTYRSYGTRIRNSSFLPNTSVPSPLTPVLENGPVNSYDANGNWLLYVHRLPNGSLLGFTHAENHNFSCSGEYAEWDAGAIVVSDNDGIQWTRSGLAIYDPQPCVPRFGGLAYSSVIPRSLLNPSFTGFLGYGGCTAFQTMDSYGTSGTWYRYLNNSFSSPGINGSSTCLPNIPGNSCCPIVHYNTYLQRFVMLITLWGVNDKVYVSFSEDAIQWIPMVEFFTVPSNRSIAYVQILGTNSTVAGQSATVVYAGAPPVSKYPRDFITRTVNFSLTSTRTTHG